MLADNAVMHRQTDILVMGFLRSHCPWAALPLVGFCISGLKPPLCYCPHHSFPVSPAGLLLFCILISVLLCFSVPFPPIYILVGRLWMGKIFLLSPTIYGLPLSHLTDSQVPSLAANLQSVLGSQIQLTVSCCLEVLGISWIQLPSQQVTHSSSSLGLFWTFSCSKSTFLSTCSVHNLCVHPHFSNIEAQSLLSLQHLSVVRQNFWDVHFPKRS